MNKHLIVITNAMSPLNKSGEVTLSKFIRTVQNAYQDITVIGGNITLERDIQGIHVESYTYHKKGNKIKKVFGMLKLQISMCSFLRKRITCDDHIIFWLGDKMILPFMMVQKISRHVGYFIYGNLATEGKGLFSKLSAKMVTYMANRANCVFVESKSVLAGWNGQIDGVIQELHLYTDIVDFNPITNRKNKVGMLCRMAGVKHVLEAIHAFVEVHDMYSDWELELVGSGVLDNECRELIKKLDAQEYIHFYGWVEKNQVPKITRKWKYGLLPSDHEGLPNSMIELMGIGVPFIATPVGGIPDILMDNINGFILDGATVAAVRKGLERAMSAQNYVQLSESAFASIKERFSLESARKEAEETLSNW